METIYNVTKFFSIYMGAWQIWIGKFQIRRDVAIQTFILGTYLQRYIDIFFKKIFIYLFIYWMGRVLVAAWGIFSWGMWAFSCGTRDPVPSPGMEPGPPALGVWSLNHWTTGEVPTYRYLEQHRFELHGSTYTWIYFSKYIGKNFGDLDNLKKLAANCVV